MTVTSGWKENSNTFVWLARNVETKLVLSGYSRRATTSENVSKKKKNGLKLTFNSPDKKGHPHGLRRSVVKPAADYSHPATAEPDG